MYLRAVRRHQPQYHITDAVKLKFPLSAIVCKNIRTQVHRCKHQYKSDFSVKNERKMTPLNQFILIERNKKLMFSILIIAFILDAS